jgi:hypothetical protein
MLQDTDWLLQPGELHPSPRLSPSGKPNAEQCEKWARDHTQEAVEELRRARLDAMPELVTTLLLKKFLVPAVWDDLERREAWFLFLLPTVKRHLSG